MSTNRTRARLATFGTLVAALLLSTVGVAAPAVAAPGTVQVTLHLSVSGKYSIADANNRLHTYPVDSVLVDVYDRNGRHTDQECVAESNWEQLTGEQHVLTRPEGLTVTVPKGGRVQAAPAMSFCYFLTLVQGTVIEKLKPVNHSATVSWHLHP